MRTIYVYLKSVKFIKRRKMGIIKVKTYNGISNLNILELPNYFLHTELILNWQYCLSTFCLEFLTKILESTDGVTVSDSKEITEIHQKNRIQAVPKGLNLTERIIISKFWKHSKEKTIEKADLILENSLLVQKRGSAKNAEFSFPRKKSRSNVK